MNEYTVTCKRELMCWLTNISEHFEILKDLGDETFQVFFRTTSTHEEIKSSMGISLGWVMPDDH